MPAPSCNRWVPIFRPPLFDLSRRLWGPPTPTGVSHIFGAPVRALNAAPGYVAFVHCHHRRFWPIPRQASSNIGLGEVTGMPACTSHETFKDRGASIGGFSAQSFLNAKELVLFSKAA